MRMVLLALLSLVPSLALTEDTAIIEYELEVSQGGEVIVKPALPNDVVSTQALDTQNLVTPQFEGFTPSDLEGHLPYLIQGRDGNESLLFVPPGQAPATWSNSNNTFGVSRVDPRILNALSLGGTSAQEKAESALREIAQAAYDQYCNTQIRPQEFTVEVEIGADFIVSGSAKISAKFVTNEICSS